METLGFQGPLRGEVLDVAPGERAFKLTSPLVYQSAILGRIEVPAHYETDFASVPRFFWRMFPPMGRYSRAAVVHDYLCDVSPKLCDHREAAEVFREAMKILNVPSWKRSTMFRAVLWCGPKFNQGEITHAETKTEKACKKGSQSNQPRRKRMRKKARR